VADHLADVKILEEVSFIRRHSHLRRIPKRDPSRLAAPLPSSSGNSTRCMGLTARARLRSIGHRPRSIE
jgi:hypothetical protein